MAGFIGGRTSAFDYIGPDLPNNPQNGEMWFDTDGASDGSGEVKVYDGTDDAWEATGFTSHADLTDVTRSAHHPPVDVSGPLTQPSDQSLGLSIGEGLLDSNGTLVADLGNGLGIDSNGRMYVPASSVEQSMLAFDTATQGELDTHAGDTSNPHNVTDDQTGAASALDNHASDTSNPHNVTDDQTGAASALDNHAGDANAHHSRPSSTDTRFGGWQSVSVSWNYTSGEKEHDIPEGRYRHMMAEIDKNNGFNIWFDGPNGMSEKWQVDSNGVQVSPDLGADTYNTIVTDAGGAGADFKGHIMILETTHSHSI